MKKNYRNQKGKILEEIIEKLYSEKGLRVQKNVYLTPINTTNIKRKKREIDILITGKVAGVNIQIAIECKNEKSKIGSPKIDGFIGKLNDLGLPTQLGIFIATNGFTKGAIGRAKQAGIKTLIFKNLTSDSLKNVIKEASQSVVQLLLCINQFSILSDVYRYNNNLELFEFYDENNKLVGTLYDIIWLYWKKNKFNNTIGSYKQKIYPPSGWFQKVDGILIKVRCIEVDVTIIGVVFGFAGHTEDFVLLNAENNTLEKRKINTKFNNIPVSVLSVKTENELSTYLNQFNKNKNVTLNVGRFKISRIWIMGLYYPQSDNSAKITMDVLRENYKKNNKTGKEIFNELISRINENFIDKAWEPICRQNQEYYKRLLKINICTVD